LCWFVYATFTLFTVSDSRSGSELSPATAGRRRNPTIAYEIVVGHVSNIDVISRCLRLCRSGAFVELSPYL